MKIIVFLYLVFVEPKVVNKLCTHESDSWANNNNCYLQIQKYSQSDVDVTVVSH